MEQSLLNFLDSNPYWPFLFVAAILAICWWAHYQLPERILGQEYYRPGKVRELDHSSSKSWTSVGPSYSSKGGFGISSQSHYIPEEYEVVIGFGPKYREIHQLDNVELYTALEHVGQIVQGVFQDITLKYRDGRTESGGRELVAIQVGKERFEV